MSEKTNRELIEDAVKREGVPAVEWREGEDGIEAVLGGSWGVIADDDDRGLCGGDEGTVTACVVGAVEFANRRVCFSFTPDGYEVGEEVRLFDDVEPI